MGINFFRRHSSICFTTAAMLLFLLCVWLLPVSVSTTGKQWLPEVVKLYGFVSSADQRWAHLIALVAVAVFSVISFTLGKRTGPSEEHLRLGRPIGAKASIVLAILGLVAYRFLVPAFIVGWAAALSILMLLLVAWSPKVPVRTVERVSIGLIGAYVAVLIVPGLLVSPIPLLEIDPNALVQFETHLLHLPLRGAAVAAGQKFFGELPLSYGLLMPSIMSVMEVKSHGLTIGGELRYVQACQALFCLAAVVAYFAYHPRNPLGVLVACLVAGAYWTTAGMGIWHPNQTGFRSLGLPLGMLALVIAGCLLPRRAAWWLGAVAGVGTLINLEISVAVSAGFAVFMVLRTRSIPWSMFLRMAAAVLLVVAMYLLVYRIALRRFPFSEQAFDILASMARFSGGDFGGRLFVSGYEGEGYYLVPFALLMFAHAIHVVIRGFRKLGSGPLPGRPAVRVSAAVTLLIWLAYYFNSPNWWQIWTMLFLYGFLIIDLVDGRRLGIGSIPPGTSISSRLSRMRIAPPVLVMLVLIAVLIPHTNRHLIKYQVAFMYPEWNKNPREVTVLSGIFMPKSQADLLEAKAKKLKELHASVGGKLVYLTFNMAFIPRLTGLFQPAPYRDMFAEIPGEAAFDESIATLLKKRPEVILIDAPTGVLAFGGPRKDFQERMRAAISARYGVAETEDGWQIWRPMGS